MTARRSILAVAIGLVAALASSLVSGTVDATYADIMGCEASCKVASAGWPSPYIVDYPGISVVGSVGLAGALLGEDHFKFIPFAVTALFWTAVWATGALLWRRRRSRARPNPDSGI